MQYFCVLLQIQQQQQSYSRDSGLAWKKHFIPKSSKLKSMLRPSLLIIRLTKCDSIRTRFAHSSCRTPNSTVHCRENHASEFVFPFGKRLRQTAQYVTISEGCISVRKVFFLFPPDREVLERLWKTLHDTRGGKKRRRVSAVTDENRRYRNAVLTEDDSREGCKSVCSLIFHGGVCY